MADDLLSEQGFTIYTDLKGAQNLFAQGAQDTPVETVMKWRGQLDFDSYPDYAKDFKMEADPKSGVYRTTGSIFIGNDAQGMPKYTSYRDEAVFETNLNELVEFYENMILATAIDAHAYERHWTPK